jgi:ribosome-associated protein
MADLIVTPRITIPDADMVLSYSRAGGPGGQSVNTTDSRVRLHFKLDATQALLPGVKARLRAALASRITNDGEIVITGDRYRSRHQNLEDVRERLVELIREHLAPPKVRRETEPSRAVQRRRVDDKKKRSGVKSSRQKPSSDE